MSSLMKQLRTTARTRTAAAPHARPPRVRREAAAPGKRTRNKEANKARILSAALAMFQTKGFEATTTKAIARKAGLAEGTVFNYFSTKEDIALYFLEQEVEQALSSVRNNARLKKAPLNEKLFALVHAQLDYLAPHERFIGAAFVQA